MELLHVKCSVLKGVNNLPPIQPIYCLLCDDVRFEIGGKVSIIGEFSQLNVGQLPITVPLCILTKWQGSPGHSALITLQMVSPDSGVPAPMGQQPIQFNHDGSELAYAGTVSKQAWQFHSEGLHSIRILANGEELGKIRFFVRQAEKGSSEEKPRH